MSSDRQIRASVVVVAYNSLPYLAACLESILADLGPHDELIVVDNGSTDGSASLLRERYPQVRLLQRANDGYAGGNNAGATLARGDVLLFLNPDTIVEPGALDALVAPLMQPGNVGLTTACVVYMDRPEVVNTCGNTMHYTGLTYCRGAGRPRTHYQHDAEVDAASGAACAIRRDLFERLGGFDPRFFMYVEDTDLSLRARLAGYGCLYVAGAVVRHDYRPAYTPRKAFYLDRNRYLMLFKNLEPATLVRMLPGLLLSELVTWGFLMLKGPRFWGVKLRVYAWLWRERVAISAARQAGQRLRRRSDRAVLRTMTHRLDFGQLAGRTLAHLARLVFDPAFQVAHMLVAGGRL